jgi:hypothetical protein
VTIRFNIEDASFHGHASSKQAACIRTRKVVVKKVRQGPDSKVGASVTNSKGAWRLPYAGRGGRFYAQISKVHAGKYTCLRDKSDTITVGHR